MWYIKENTQQLWQNRNLYTYPILAQSQSIFYLHKASMMLGHCTQHEQNPDSSQIYITTNIQNLLYKGHKCYILAQSQGIFYMHQVPIVVDYCIKYQQNQPILLWDIAPKIKFKKYIAIITQIWHSQIILYMHQQHMVSDYCTI